MNSAGRITSEDLGGFATSSERRGIDPPSRSSIYRVLVRHHLVDARRRKRRRDDYIRWERDAPMNLWQLDLMGSVFLVDGTECKLVTGIDDHSRFCVIARVVARGTGRQVCAAFAAALTDYGSPTKSSPTMADNSPGASASLVWARSCSSACAGTTASPSVSPGSDRRPLPGRSSVSTKPSRTRSWPSKRPFVDLQAAQFAADEWRRQYNHERPHQSLDMATPASRFRPVPEAERAELPLKLPPSLSPASTAPSSSPRSQWVLLRLWRRATQPLQWIPMHSRSTGVVPACGNLKVSRQQFWLGPRLSGHTITLWIDTKTVHVSLDRRRLKTLPSRLSEVDLARLRKQGARPAGPPPAPPSAMLAQGVALEVDRPVNACGLVALGGIQFGVGQVLAGRRVTLRLEGDLIHVVADGVLARTLVSPLEPEQLVRLRGASVAGPPPVTGGPIRVQRRVSCRGAISIATQRVHVGIVHARKVVTVELHDTVVRVIAEDARSSQWCPARATRR